MGMFGNDIISSGIYQDMENETYHSQKHAVSNSGLGDVLRSPYHYWAKHLNPERPHEKQRAGQLEGTLAHCAILEPDEFSKRYRVGPYISKATKAWKEEAEKAAADGVELIKPDQYDVAMRQAEQVRTIPDVAEALARGVAESSAFWNDPETGVLCRCRPDWVHETASGDVILLDVKTYSSAEPDEFARQIARKGYERQDAMYSDGYGHASGKKVLGFAFIAAEMEYPYAASVVMLDDESKDAGHRRYRDALELYAACKQKDQWPGYTTGIEVVRLPNYKLAV